MINKEHYHYIRQHQAFANLPVELFDKLAVEIQYRRIPKGQIIFFAGDRRERLFLLYQGYVRIEQYDSTDTFSYMDYVKKGSVFPYGGMFFDERYHYTASAVTNVEYFSLPIDLFEAYSKQSVSQLLFITKRLSQILEFQELRLRNVVSASATERVVQSLSILCMDLCQESGRLPFPISMKELAKLGATTRETVNQVLKKLRDDGRIDYEHKLLTFKDKDFFMKYFRGS
ncbi:Crp/Fnr family transcriptional regulator [Streptococcus panodentis]|uniref:Crp/Fnr family transcriptional regulator n=1 Tax=Streptococcus panodentis TaxID=1581472 RepID=A0ABS5AVA5_9STRE|nr:MULTISPECIES: Crp/Fnr family transcriptional regulator [Streptococcus]MBP2620201.1 Crp/Fnr family transcriptional regulator [Streptococcus panodentis]